MIKKLLYILFLIPLLTIGQYNFFASYPSCYLCYLHEYTQQYNTGANHDIFFNSTGTYMYILGGQVSTTIYQYSLSPAWNIRSASYYSSYGVENEETDPYGIFIKPDGTKLYVVGADFDNIYQYTLTTPWVISTATYDSKYFYIGGSENIPTALFFSSDGSKVFFLGQQNKTVYVLSLLTNWDISTANTEAEEYDFSSDEIYPHDLFFSSDGLTMYVEGINQDKLFRYSLSTAWTLPDPWNEANVTPVDNFALTGDQAQGIYIKPDWTKVYTVGVASVNVYYFNEPGIHNEEYPIIALGEYVAGGNIFVSTDGGNSWTEISTGFTNHVPRSISVGYDNHNIVVTGNSSSNEDVAFWSNSTGSSKELIDTSPTTDGRYWAAAHCSLDGTHFYWMRTHTSEYVWYSLNSGESSTYTSAIGIDQPCALASSYNNNIIYIGGQYLTSDFIRKSTTGIAGTYSSITIWADHTHPGVACSSDGQIVYVVKGNPETSLIIAKSTDGLSNTTDVTITTGLTSTYARTVSCSADGKYVLVVDNTAKVAYVSNNYGASGSWTQVLSNYNPFNNWGSGNCVSYSGKYMILAENVTTNKYHLSTDYGVTWTLKDTPAGYPASTVTYGVAIQD